MAASILAICVFEDRTINISELKTSDLQDVLQSLEWEKLSYSCTFTNKAVARKKALSEQITAVKAEIRSRSIPNR